MRMSWRLASRLSVITLALLVVLIVALWGLRNTNGSANANQSGLQGTSLDNKPAPNFRLTDQFGKPVSLAQFRGEPVVLTFMYTHCQSACPLTANKFHMVQLQLGKQASQVMMLAVSIDPKGDTEATAQQFSKAHQLRSNWHYLLGTQAELAPVWNAYSISASPSMNQTTAIYVIDKQGNERVFLDNDFTPAQLTSDLKILLAE